MKRFCTLHVRAPTFQSSRALGEFMSYADGTVEGTSQCRTGLQANQLHGGSPWPYGILDSSRVLAESDCFVPLKHSFRECAVANRTARSRYSVLYVLINKGDKLFCVTDRKKEKITSFGFPTWSFDANMYASKPYRCRSNDVMRSNNLFETRMGLSLCQSKRPDPKSEAPMNR